jgi:uncharacterized protein YjiS (DUF1127 family)
MQDGGGHVVTVHAIVAVVQILLLRADSVLLDEPKQRFTEIIMTTISSGLTARQGIAGQSWGRELVVICKRWWATYTAWRIEQEAISQLWSMSDRELKDIGLTRSEIPGAVKVGARAKA